ncbi:MAG: radical SAM protein [Caldilineaceae bacterium]|nr:radical SAM protein [Caldilineaceae bacterium]MCB9157307.1 radical SAM protein [Caldilineaceae bacterium]
MRRIVLIRPKRDGRIFGKAPGSPYTLMRLASLVPDEIPVEIWDENLIDLPLDTLREGDLVGITSMTVTIDGAEQISRRAMQQGAGVVVGGVHATLMPEHTATFAHSVMTGEGYFTWQRLIQDFAADGVKGMKPFYSDETWAELDGIATISDRVIKMVNEQENYWTPYLEITRGCPRNCSFCTAIRVSGRKMRLRPIDEVVDEIERRGIKRFFLTDDNFGLNFTTDPDYCSRLFDALSKLDLHSWTCQSEMSVAKYPDLLEHSLSAHLDKHFIGFESVNPDNRRELGGKSKGVANSAEEAIRTIRETGVGVVGLFVMGFDEDTPATFQAMWDFIRNSDLDSISTTMLTPYPGTPFREVVEQEGRLLDVPWSHYDTAHVTFIPKNFTVEELRSAYDWLCRKTYSPTQIALRGYRSFRRHPLRLAGKKLFGSFSTDYGYRRTYAYRNAL